MQRTLLALALILSSGASYAQTMQTNEPHDPYGRPLIGRNDWVRQPGDEAGPRGGAGMQSSTTMNASPNVAQAPMTMPAQSGPHQPAFKDEYGFRYDAQGNRLDARGNIISPHTR